MLEEGLAGSIADALDQPLDIAIKILELRAYQRTREAIDRAENQESVPTGAMADLVMGIYEDIAAKEQQRRVRHG